MKNLFTLTLILVIGLNFNTFAANANVALSNYSLEIGGDEEYENDVNFDDLKKMSDRKIGKFLGSKKYDKDGTLENYIGGFIDVEGVKMKHFRFYKNKETREVIVINKKTDEVISTGDYL